MSTGPHTKLLVVDDEPIIVEFLVTSLSSGRCKIEVAFDGAEAIEKARVFRPEFVLTGQVMPKIGGLEAAVEILRFLPQCKFVFVTSNANEAWFLAEYTEKGFDPQFLLSKPFQRAHLLAVMAQRGFPVP
jgi:CheY-like chemotaxis protein